jgi:GNAT superfamily N-acetyltransferase
MRTLAELDLPGGPVVLRLAAADDLPDLVALLADDQLGAQRESTDPAGLAPYRAAFDAIAADPHHLLVVAVDGGAQVVGTLQLSLVPGLSRRGAWRAQIEAVRVGRAARGGGLGTGMIEWAVGEARRRGCALVQLTTDRRRHDAHRFYRRLGFTDSHVGMKLPLPGSAGDEQP